MSFDQPFTDPLLTQKRSGSQDSPFLQITELISVINGKALLTEIPRKYDRVQIIEVLTSGSGGDVSGTVDGGSFSDTYPTIDSNVPSTFYETESGSLTSTNQYYVDYNQGVLTFHPSQEGLRCVVKYVGMGTHFFPVSRIYTKADGNQVVETLDDVVTTGADKIEEITTSIEEANAATINANNATAELETLIDTQKLVYKTSVANFAAISSTYPTPQVGWRVVAKDTGIAYRYDGTSWVDIGLSSEGSGFTVIVGNTPPSNINTIWVNAPVANYAAKIVQSDTAPSDTSVIWWKTT